MEPKTALFWTLIALLLGASGFYGHGAWQLQAAARSRDAVLASGDAVQLVQIIDGDTIVVAKEGQGNTTVRILGIKTFESKHGKDEAALHGRAAEQALRQLADGVPLRVLLNQPPRDKAGRTLATLFAGSEDIGLALVARGLALVYTVYPFAHMQAYLQAQAAARQQRLGLWADPAVVDRADGLVREWARAAP